MTDRYRYAVAMYDGDGQSPEQVPIEVDWGPAEEWAKFSAIRKAELPPSDSRARASVHPIWHPKLGRPYTSGFRVRVHGTREATTDFSAAYFQELAERESYRLVNSAKLQPGETFRYVVAAFPVETAPRENDGLAVEVEDLSPALPVREGALEEVLMASNPHGPVVDSDIPVFVPERVVGEASDRAREAGAIETGGILVGHLHRDQRVPEIYAVITEQIPAFHALGDSTRLTFTERTWTDVQAVLDLRRKDEMMLGWWHSHPVHHWCKKCPVARRRKCPLGSDFLSDHDRALHRTVFPAAYSFALVINGIAPDEQTQSLFGWRAGLLRPRGFHVLDGLELGSEPPPRAA